MKRIFTLFLCLVLILGSALLFTGCFIVKEEYSSGDFTYKKFGSKKSWYAEITGLSEQGKTKEVVIIPEIIGGLPVEAIRDRYFLAVNAGEEKWASKQLTKIYLVKDMDVRAGCWQECPNLKQIIVVNATKGNCFHVSKGAFNNVNLYFFKNFYEAEISSSKNKLSYLHPASVTYYYNYSGAPNGGCYWLDQVDVGDRITFIPSNPTHQDNSYKFGGWHTDKECTNRWDFATNTMLDSGELALYAKWIKN